MTSKFNEGQHIIYWNIIYQISHVDLEHYSLEYVSEIAPGYINSYERIKLIDEQAILVHTDIDFFEDILKL